MFKVQSYYLLGVVEMLPLLHYDNYYFEIQMLPIFHWFMLFASKCEFFFICDELEKRKKN